MNASESEGAAVDAPRSRARANRALAAFRLVKLAVWTAYCYSSYLAARGLARDRSKQLAASYRWTHRWFHGGARIFRIAVRVVGEPPSQPALVTPNHTGYADIIALGSVLNFFFVAKTDVAEWPVIGRLFTSSEQIGVSRKGNARLGQTNDAIREKLQHGHRVCAFLEGTSTGGDRLLKFRPSLLQAAIDEGVPVIPAALRWRSANPDVVIVDDVAYWKDHVFVNHIWRLLGLNGIEVDIAFGAPITEVPDDRKALAASLESAVRDLLEPSG